MIMIIKVVINKYMKYKVGDKVKFINSDEFLPLNSIHTITQVDEEDDVVPYYLDDDYWVDESDIALAETNWDTLEAGDIIINSYGDEALIIDILPNSFVKSLWGNFEITANIYSKKEAQANGWTIKEAETVKEMTLADAEKLVEKLGGGKVKIIK